MDASYNTRRAGSLFAASQQHKPYDTNWTQKNSGSDSPSWYCSELVWAAYLSQGVNLESSPDTWVVAPDEIFNSNHTSVVGGHVEANAKDTGLAIRAHSPVNISITDPDGLSISLDSNGIPNAQYVIDDIDGDGDPEVTIYIENRKTGDYHITVIPKSDAMPTDTY